MSSILESKVIAEFWQDKGLSLVANAVSGEGESGSRSLTAKEEMRDRCYSSEALGLT